MVAAAAAEEEEKAFAATAPTVAAWDTAVGSEAARRAEEARRAEALACAAEVTAAAWGRAVASEAARPVEAKDFPLAEAEVVVAAVATLICRPTLARIREWIMAVVAAATEPEAVPMAAVWVGAGLISAHLHAACRRPACR